MSSITKLSCPVCGSRVTLRQLNKAEENREIKAFTFTFGGKVKGDKKGRGKAKGICEFVETETSGNDSLEDYWIHKLTEIIKYLKGNREIEQSDENDISTDNEIEIESDDEEDESIHKKRTKSEEEDEEDNDIFIDVFTDNEIETETVEKTALPVLLKSRKRIVIESEKEEDEDEDVEEVDIFTDNEIDIDDFDTHARKQSRKRIKSDEDDIFTDNEIDNDENDYESINIIE